MAVRGLAEHQIILDLAGAGSESCSHCITSSGPSTAPGQKNET